MWLTYGNLGLFAITLLQFALINATPASTKERPALIACREIARNMEPQLVPHILGSKTIEPGEYPHMGIIGYRNDQTDKYSYGCGVTLIAKRFLLTVAHCVTDDLREAKVVRLNFTDFKDPQQEFIEMPIERIHVHPDFSRSSIYNDIAVIEVERDVPFSRTCRPACLFTDKEPPADATLRAASWRHENERKLSDTLLRYRVNIQALDVCNATVFSFGLSRRFQDGIRETQLCAQNTDSCRSQSGVPLVSVVDEGLQLYSAVGLFAAGTSCGAEFPEILTRVSAYLDFIESIVWPEFSERMGTE